MSLAEVKRCLGCQLTRYERPNGTSFCSAFDVETGIGGSGPVLAPVNVCDHPDDFQSLSELADTVQTEPNQF